MTTTDRIITAQRLRDGVVVFLGHRHEWVETTDAAQPMTPDAAEAALVWAREAHNALEIVDPYAIPLAATEGAIVPLKIRERIRVSGPTVRPDLRKAKA